MALLLALGALAEPPDDVALANGPASEEYFIVIDAGSSGCRVHVFSVKWTGAADGLPTVAFPAPKMKTNPGLSDFEENPDEAGASLAPLMKFAFENIPREKHASTPVRLAATAGLRFAPPPKKTWASTTGLLPALAPIPRVP